MFEVSDEIPSGSKNQETKLGTPFKLKKAKAVKKHSSSGPAK